MKETRKHSMLSPSSAARWLKCYPSAWLEQLPDSESFASKEGTLAHKLAEMKFKGIEPRRIKNSKEYTQEMEDHVDKYVAFVKDLAADNEIFTETLVKSREMPELFGTIDCYFIDNDTLNIIDFKYGKYKVEAAKNFQMLTYASILTEILDTPINKINLIIFQPRISLFPDIYTLAINDLRTFINKRLKPAYQSIVNKQGVLVKGNHCRFCRAKCEMYERGKANLNIVSGRKKHALRVVIYGPEGVGKSTLASKMPKPLFIDVEGGSYELDVSRFEERPKTWEKLLDQIKYVKENPFSCRTLIIDTIDAVENLAVAHICRENSKNSLGDFNYGKGYQYLTDAITQLLDLLNEINELGINVVLIGHSQITKFEKPDETGQYDRYSLKLLKRDEPVVKEWSDMLLFINYKEIIVQQDSGRNKAIGGERVIYTTHKPAFDAKNRFNLDEELPLNFNSIRDVFMLDTGEEAPIDDDFSLLENQDDVIDSDFLEDFTELPPDEPEEITELKILMDKEGFTEEQVVNTFKRGGFQPEKNTDAPKIEDYQLSFLRDKVINQWGVFSGAVRRSINE